MSAPRAKPTASVIEQTFREEHGAVMATLVRQLGTLDRAEDALQDAFTSAFERWPTEGIPHNPAAWITTAARRKAIDRLRRQTTARKSGDALVVLASLEREEAEATSMAGMDTDVVFEDDQLRLIFTCCHPALAQEAQVALTLRTLCGLTTPQIGRAFLVPEATLAQRLVRAKRKIQNANIPYEVPGPEALGERMSSVLAVIYLVFNEGYAASEGDALVRIDLCREAIRLARLLGSLSAGQPEVDGLLALMLLHDARRDARTDEHGDLVTLEQQDRSRWDRPQIDEGLTILRAALAARRAGPYQLQAAIAAIHADAQRPEDTDWAQIAQLYAALRQQHDTAVIALNHAVAVAMATTPEQGIALLDTLREPLESYCPLHAAEADLLRRAGRLQEAAAAYARAADLADNEATRRYLQRRLVEVSS